LRCVKVERNKEGCLSANELIEYKNKQTIINSINLKPRYILFNQLFFLFSILCFYNTHFTCTIDKKREMNQSKIKLNAVMEIAVLSLLFSMLLFLFSSCKHTILTSNEVDEVFPDTTTNSGGINQNTIPCDEDTVYFNNTILPLFVSNCAKSGCHDAISAQEGIVLNSYATIMASGEIIPGNPNDGDIMETITETDPDDIMPPPGNTPLTQQQINQIALWISQGAQNNYCNSCDTTNVTFNTKIKPIIDLKCKGCHSGANPSFGMDLSTYANVVAIGQTGQLLGSIKHQAPYYFMPKNSAAMPPCEIDMIRIWIQTQYPQ
jgi:uncharacterized membrane protein